MDKWGMTSKPRFLKPAGLESTGGDKGPQWKGGYQLLAEHFKKAVKSLIGMLFFGKTLSKRAQEGERVNGRIWAKSEPQNS